MQTAKVFVEIPPGYGIEWVRQRVRAKAAKERARLYPAPVLVAAPEAPSEPSIADNPHLSRDRKIAMIGAEVCARHHAKMDDLHSSSRSHHIVAARHEFAYRLRNEMKFTLIKIADILRMKDHSSVHHAVQAHAARNGLDGTKGAAAQTRCASRLGIDTGALEPGTNVLRPWARAYLRTHFDRSQSKADIGKKLGLSVSAVGSHAKRLGLTSRTMRRMQQSAEDRPSYVPGTNKLSTYADGYIRKHYNQGKSATEIARHLTMDRKTVQRAAHRIGLATKRVKI